MKIKTNSKIKILLLEDNPADSAFIKEKIIEEGLDADITFAENRYEFELAINSTKKYDLVLSDYITPGLDGFTAFRIFSEKYPDIPFILISGETEEEYAVEAIKMGITDYVFKHRIQRLGPAVRRAMREYEEKLEYRRIQEYQLLLNGAIEECNEGIIITDNTKPGNPVVFVNKAFATITGYTKDEVLGKNLEILYNFDKEQIEIKHILNAVEKEEDCIVILKNYKKDGSLLWNEIHLSPVRNNGVVNHFIGIINDVTEKVKNKQEIIKLSRAVQQSPVPVLITDSTGIIEYVNIKFEEQTGYKSSELIGKHTILFKSDKLSSNIYNLIKRSISDKIISKGEFKSIKKNGEEYWENIKVTPLKHFNEITNYLVTFADITSRKKAEEEIIAAKEKAEEINRLKTAFLSNMSHELRTPLIGINGYSKILIEEIENPELKEMAETIHSCGNSLTETLNLILDFSRIESESVSLKQDNLDITIIIKDIIEKYKSLAEEKELYLKLQVKNNLIVYADEQILIKVLNNVINNAIKYTCRGGVSVSVESFVKESQGYAAIKIADTGIGISHKNFSRIFEPFRQGSEGLNRDYQGLGLGLNITKKFVEKMNGEVKFESTPGNGSVFALLLPLSVKNPEVDNTEEKKLFSSSYENGCYEKYKILVVEDDVINMDIIKIFLKDFCEVKGVYCGDEAVNLAKQEMFDAILMDIGLKGMNGIDATRLIRKIPGYENVPITAVTAYTMSGDREKFLAAGCNYYLPKPFTKSTLIEHIHTCINEFGRNVSTV